MKYAILIVIFIIGIIVMRPSPEVYRIKNFKTDLVEERKQNDSVPSAEKMREYIPQDVLTQWLYGELLKIGYSPAEAVVLTLEAILANENMYKKKKKFLLEA